VGEGQEPARTGGRAPRRRRLGMSLGGGTWRHGTKRESGYCSCAGASCGDPPPAPAVNGRKNSAPAARRGFFCRLFHWNVDVATRCCRSLPRRGLGWCVPLLTRLGSSGHIHSVGVPQNAASSPRLGSAGAFFDGADTAYARRLKGWPAGSVATAFASLLPSPAPAAAPS